MFIRGVKYGTSLVQMFSLSKWLPRVIKSHTDIIVFAVPFPLHLKCCNTNTDCQKTRWENDLRLFLYLALRRTTSLDLLQYWWRIIFSQTVRLTNTKGPLLFLITSGLLHKVLFFFFFCYVVEKMFFLIKWLLPLGMSGFYLGYVCWVLF